MRQRVLSLVMLLLAVPSAVAQQAKPPSSAASSTAATKAPALPVFTFPPVTYACIPLPVPDDDAQAEKAVDEARVRWYQTARRANLKEAGGVFVHAKAPLGDSLDNPQPLPAEACAIVGQGKAVEGMTMHKLPARQGLAGFCDKMLDVQECLARASKEGGFSASNPWPWLPLYARWPPDRPVPASGNDIIQYLRTAVFSIPIAPSGSGEPHVVNTGLRPLVVECKDCPVRIVPDDIKASGKGIAWFIPLQ